ncbi:hypothetical protein DFS34DRAFT_154240 [Phlyctochytrium arcticum]|nr:hypothetical protein DFS34DRAFT_154240 [Phlyctochytrium arcticum]
MVVPFVVSTRGQAPTPTCFGNFMPNDTEDARELAEFQKLHLLQLEMDPRYQINPIYMKTLQRNTLTPNHRKELIDWLHELSKHFRYNGSEVFQLSVIYLDRICSREHIPLLYYQTLGAACFLIAAKVGELRTPTCLELEQLSAGAFTVAKLQEMELWVLKKLCWDLNAATPNMFLEYFIDLFDVEESTKYELIIIADKALNRIQAQYKFTSFRPSVQAAAALYFAVDSHGPITAASYVRAISRDFEKVSSSIVSIVSSLDVPVMSDVHLCLACIFEDLEQTPATSPKTDAGLEAKVRQIVTQQRHNKIWFPLQPPPESQPAKVPCEVERDQSSRAEDQAQSHQEHEELFRRDQRQRRRTRMRHGLPTPAEEISYQADLQYQPDIVPFTRSSNIYQNAPLPQERVYERPQHPHFARHHPRPQPLQTTRQAAHASHPETSSHKRKCTDSMDEFDPSYAESLDEEATASGFQSQEEGTSPYACQEFEEDDHESHHLAWVVDSGDDGAFESASEEEDVQEVQERRRSSMPNHNPTLLNRNPSRSDMLDRNPPRSNVLAPFRSPYESYDIHQNVPSQIPRDFAVNTDPSDRVFAAARTRYSTFGSTTSATTDDTPAPLYHVPSADSSVASSPVPAPLPNALSSFLPPPYAFDHGEEARILQEVEERAIRAAQYAADSVKMSSKNGSVRVPMPTAGR